jgi:hypothetical protein
MATLPRPLSSTTLEAFGLSLVRSPNFPLPALNPGYTPVLYASGSHFTATYVITVNMHPRLHSWKSSNIHNSIHNAQCLELFALLWVADKSKKTFIHLVGLFLIICCCFSFLTIRRSHHRIKYIDTAYKIPSHHDEFSINALITPNGWLFFFWITTRWVLSTFIIRLHTLHCTWLLCTSTAC